MSQDENDSPLYPVSVVVIKPGPVEYVEYWPQHPVTEICDTTLEVPNPFADLTRQRDEALAKLKVVERSADSLASQLRHVLTDNDAGDARIEELEADRDAWSAKCAEQATEMDRLRGLNLDLSDTNDHLANRLFWFLGAEDPVAEPEHNPFREFPDDRRRVGG